MLVMEADPFFILPSQTDIRMFSYKNTLPFYSLKKKISKEFEVENIFCEIVLCYFEMIN